MGQPDAGQDHIVRWAAGLGMSEYSRFWARACVQGGRDSRNKAGLYARCAAYLATSSPDGDSGVIIGIAKVGE